MGTGGDGTQRAGWCLILEPVPVNQSWDYQDLHPGSISEDQTWPLLGFCSHNRDNEPGWLVPLQQVGAGSPLTPSSPFQEGVQES